MDGWPSPEAKGQGTVLSETFGGVDGPVDTMVRTFSLQNYETTHFSSTKPPSLWYSVTTALAYSHTFPSSGEKLQ